MQRGRRNLEFMTDKSARNVTFKKRKNGLIKKANELATLCGVKACVVVDSYDKMEPEFFPSKEGAEEVYTKFLAVRPEERSKYMYDQDRFLSEKIHKGREKTTKLQAENREMELREVMFDLLKGKTMSPDHSSDPGFLGELNLFIADLDNKLTHRIKFLGGNDAPNVAVTEASGPVVGDVNPLAVGTEGLVSSPTEFYDLMRQYDGVDMSVIEQADGGSNDHVHHQNMNLEEPFQYQTPASFDDQILPWFDGSSEGMNMNLEEPFQYQSPPNFDDQTQPGFDGSSQDMYTALSHDQENQYPDQHQSLLMGQPQQMSDVQDLANVASMDDNSYSYHQLPGTDPMPVTTTTTTATPAADLSDHSITKKRWPTRLGLD